jgi:hypothetical protein
VANQRSARLNGIHSIATFSTTDNLANRTAKIDLQPLASGDFQLAGSEPQLVQNRGVQIGYVMAILHGVEAQLVGGAVCHAAFDAATG